MSSKNPNSLHKSVAFERIQDEDILNLEDIFLNLADSNTDQDVKVRKYNLRDTQWAIKLLDLEALFDSNDNQDLTLNRKKQKAIKILRNNIVSVIIRFGISSEEIAPYIYRCEKYTCMSFLDSLPSPIDASKIQIAYFLKNREDVVHLLKNYKKV